MKLLINLTILTFLTSCSVLNSNNIAPGYKAAYKNINLYFFPEDNSLITPEVIKEIPYASLLIKLGRTGKNLVILESIKDDIYTYLSSDSVYISIKSGRVIKTAGLKNNLVEFIEPFSINDFDFSNNKYIKSVLFYSYDSPELIRLKVQSITQDKGLETVDLFTSRMELRRYEETLTQDYLGWKVTNKFWLDENGFIWKSIQYISPKLPPIEIIVTKKPA